MDLSITKAEPGDAPEISSIEKTLTIDWNHPEGMQKKGFFVLPKSEDKIRNIIALSSHFFVAKDNEKLVGFVMAYSREVLSEIATGAEDFSLNKYALEHPADSLIYIDHIGVLPERQGTGVAQALLNTLLESAPDCHFLAYILHEPIRNERSIKLFSRNNPFLLTREIPFDDKSAGAYEYDGNDSSG